MTSVAFVAALVGALISAALSFWIRSHLDKRATREAELKLAYVHFVSVSEVHAIFEVVRRYLAAAGVTEAYARLADPELRFAASHKACHLLANALTENDNEFLTSSAPPPSDLRMLRTALEASANSVPSTEHLSKLPRSIVPLFQQFQGSLATIKIIADLWLSMLESKQPDWVSADALHEQWLAVVRFAALVSQVRNQLIAIGATTTSEAAELLAQQVRFVVGAGFSRAVNQPKIKAVLGSITEVPSAG